MRAAAYGGVAALTASGVKQILGRRRGAAASRVSIATGGGIRSWAERRVVAGVDCRCGSTRAKPRLRVASIMSVEGAMRSSVRFILQSKVLGWLGSLLGSLRAMFLKVLFSTRNFAAGTTTLQAPKSNAATPGDDDRIAVRSARNASNMSKCSLRQARASRFICLYSRAGGVPTRGLFNTAVRGDAQPARSLESRPLA